MLAPIFIFSLPRSGSTLLQRTLSGHPDIATSSEPWILLPFCYSTNSEGVLSEYIHHTSYRAINDFVNSVGKERYSSELAKFVTSLYESLCTNDEKYFIDKTPRYYLIINEIKYLFPNAKIIFLFRNPVHVLGSIIDTFSNRGLKKIHAYDIDMTIGFEMLSNGFESLKDEAYFLRYEEFVTSPEKHLIEICQYLELEFQPEMLSSLSGRKITGNMGDPVKSNTSRNIDSSSMNKWKKSCAGIYRKRVVKKYIKNIEERAFESQGYSKQLILEEVSGLEGHFHSFINDIIHYNLGRIINIFKLNIFRGKSYRVWTKRKYLG
ncbi:sulfotransferase family protein [Aliiglaciecola lipolytica]|uniref:Sulfotransferase n=1 Tax=Aliiglaciecola lipolytica E3 TaxID=1127673 RepID=K6X763_9ALTE|nr:sulfotransferase [Aliiglaciecola lipolytica]GAC16444.1 hypothetical protein GLIP_3833 [Aliiglaciecola lipolytica E3]